MIVDDGLPAGWKIQPLDALATTQLGKTINPKEKNGPRQRPYLRNANVQWDEFKLDDVYTMHFSEEESRQFSLEPGDLLVCEGGDVGRAAIWQGEVANCQFQNALHRLRPKDDAVTAAWLLENFRYLTSSGQIMRRARGNTIMHLSQKELRNLPIVVAPRSVEDRIVSVLEDLRRHRASSQAHLGAALTAIKRFRHVVLAAGCSGRLTADWRERHEGLPTILPPLAKLRASRTGQAPGRSSVEQPNKEDLEELPETWDWASVGEVASVQLGGTPSRKTASYWSGGIPWVSSGEVANCRVSSTRETISEQGLGGSNAKLYPPGTVLVAMIGEGKTRGQSAILDIEAATNQNVAGILPNVDVVKPEYVWRWALAQYEITRAVGRGGNQPALNAQKVRELTIPVPPLDEQDEIVRRVNQLLKSADGLREHIDATSRRVELSSQAALAKAFRGELITEEAAQIG